jgi:hypothetical protein
VPDHEGGGGWWSVDHLLIDQDAVPTFVEVKGPPIRGRGGKSSRRCSTTPLTAQCSGHRSSSAPGSKAMTRPVLWNSWSTGWIPRKATRKTWPARSGGPRRPTFGRPHPAGVCRR